MTKAADIIRELSESDIFRDYEKAFSGATQLPLSLRAKAVWQPALHGKKNENPFCALMAKSSRGCSACLQVQEELTGGDSTKPHTVTCFAGLCDTAVPLSVGGELIGYLQTGQVALRRPSKALFSRISRQLLQWGAKVDLSRLEDAYFHSRVLSREQYESKIRLLDIFAQHLSAATNQALLRTKNAEPPLIARAKKIVRESGSEPVSLTRIAKALNVSTFYFCKMFKKATGLTFTDYVARCRIEKARNLLLNPHVRISEAAYESGFSSITHFNRSFRRVSGESPTAYRKKLAILKPIQ
jgi:AraC-like DNA-binding protein/ligand-binding sensor protein